MLGININRTDLLQFWGREVVLGKVEKGRNITVVLCYHWKARFLAFKSRMGFVCWLALHLSNND